MQFGTFYHFLKTFLFCIGVELIDNVVIVSGAQQSDTALNLTIWTNWNMFTFPIFILAPGFQQGSVNTIYRDSRHLLPRIMWGPSNTDIENELFTPTRQTV